MCPINDARGKNARRGSSNLARVVCGFCSPVGDVLSARLRFSLRLAVCPGAPLVLVPGSTLYGCPNLGNLRVVTLMTTTFKVFSSRRKSTNNCGGSESNDANRYRDYRHDVRFTGGFSVLLLSKEFASQVPLDTIFAVVTACPRFKEPDHSQKCYFSRCGRTATYANVTNTKTK